MAQTALRTLRVKIVFIGDDGVGKTSIAKRYVGYGFDAEYKSTVGADFYIMKEKYSFPKLGQFLFYWMIWDLAGQKYFNIVRPIYYEGAKAAIVVFDVSRPQTFRSIPRWISEFWRYAGGLYPLVLVGNKVDLRNERPCIPKEYGERYAEQLSERLGIKVPYIETSAKTGYNIKEAFDSLARTIIMFTLKKIRK